MAIDLNKYPQIQSMWQQYSPTGAPVDRYYDEGESVQSGQRINTVAPEAGRGWYEPNLASYESKLATGWQPRDAGNFLTSLGNRPGQQGGSTFTNTLGEITNVAVPALLAYAGGQALMGGLGAGGTGTAAGVSDMGAVGAEIAGLGSGATGVGSTATGLGAAGLGTAAAPAAGSAGMAGLGLTDYLSLAGGLTDMYGQYQAARSDRIGADGFIRPDYRPSVPKPVG
jgi:hypothetical protein